jgi:MFS family permease
VSASSASRRTFAALATRNFRLYFIGQLVSVSGTWMQTVAMGWLILRLTSNSAAHLGASVALQYLPMLLFATYGGVIADRHDKRRILYVTQSSAGLCALALGVLVSTNHATVASIYVVSLLLGIVNLFDMPARQAFVQEMVGRELIANAVSLNSVLMNAGRLVGPMIAGLFIALTGIAACFYANAASYAAVLVALAMMRSHELTPIRTVRREKRQLRLGLHYVGETPLLRDVLIAVAVVGTFAFNFTVTLPLFARVTFHDSNALGYMMEMTAMGLGAMVGGLYIAHRQRPTLRLLAVLGTTFGLFMTAVAVAPTLGVAVILMVPMGAVSIAFVSTGNAILQLNSAEQMRGRVMSLYGTAFLGTTPIGALVIAAIIAASNPRVGMLVGSLLTLATGLALLGVLHRREIALNAVPAS